ncbi:MAG: PAS domain-containing protein, partial [Anaerolineae bacterium]
MNKERTYQSIFEAASDALIVHDMETGRVVDANPAAGAMHGYAREEFVG